MADRLIMELKSNFKNELQIDENLPLDKNLNINTEINKMLDDLQFALKSLNYKNNEIRSILPLITKETDDLTKKDKNISFENLLKFAINYLDKNSSNIAS